MVQPTRKLCFGQWHTYASEKKLEPLHLPRNLVLDLQELRTEHRPEHIEQQLIWISNELPGRDTTSYHQLSIGESTLAAQLEDERIRVTNRTKPRHNAARFLLTYEELTILT